VHADVITGFPTEDDAAFERSLSFLRTLDPAGLHVFRYSSRPGTPATRMAGQVPERVKKARAARLLELSASAKAAFARRSLGTESSVLLETRLDDGRWVGHADDHVVVAVTPRDADPVDLENAVVRVRRDVVDEDVPDRVEGGILAIDLPDRALRPTIPVVPVPFGP
jgi:threonylcarbamoyladenosine tRNA methylthiotransferase MtaB